jgi:hypothetical protein
MLLVVPDQFGSLSADFFEYIVDEGVHNAHTALGDPRLRMDLLQDSVNVHRVSFCAVFAWLLSGLDRIGSGFGSRFASVAFSASHLSLF